MATEAAARTRESLMAVLKAETASLHERIEQVVPLMRPELDRAAYRGYLARLLGYLAPLEERLAVHAAPLLAWGIELRDRLRADLVVADLLALGAAPAEIEGLPRCSTLPALATIDEAWGCLYVTEGSTLGGQVILRTLGPRLDLSAARGLGFLAGHGEQTGSYWKALSAAVARFDEAGGDRAKVLRGARETFATQIDWFSAERALA